MPGYVLSRRRILPGLAAGALLGAAVVALWINAPAVLKGDPGAGSIVGATFVVALIMWTLGLATVGGLLWTASESKGWRSPAWAVLVGMIATFAATVLLQLLFSVGTVTWIVGGKAQILEGQRTVYGWWRLAVDGWLMSLLGGAVSGLVWRIAYRRSP